MGTGPPQPPSPVRRPLFRKFWVVLVPFEIAFSLYSLYMGISGLLGFGSVSSSLFVEVLGRWSIPFNLLYAVSGLAIYTGLVTLRRNVEAFGLITLATSLIIRSIVLLWCSCGDRVVLGQVVNVHVLNLVFLVACVARIVSLLEKRYIEVSETPIKVRIR
jgi:hypothetical protein